MTHVMKTRPKSFSTRLWHAKGLYDLKSYPRMPLLKRGDLLMVAFRPRPPKGISGEALAILRKGVVIGYLPDSVRPVVRRAWPCYHIHATVWRIKDRYCEVHVRFYAKQTQD